jgi:hypothetical protein
VVTRAAYAPPGSHFRLGFRDGMAQVESQAGEPLSLNGARAGNKIVLLVGDVVEAVAGGRLEVLA